MVATAGGGDAGGCSGGGDGVVVSDGAVRMPEHPAVPSFVTRCVCGGGDTEHQTRTEVSTLAVWGMI